MSKKIPGVTFSAKRALGVTQAKRKISKATGIPTSKQGRRAKVGKIASGGGCLLPVLLALILTALIVVTVA